MNFATPESIAVSPSQYSEIRSRFEIESSAVGRPPPSSSSTIGMPPVVAATAGPLIVVLPAPLLSPQRPGLPVAIDRHGGLETHEPPICCAARREPEQRAVDGVDGRRRDADAAEAEREDGVLVVAGVMAHAPIGGEGREVGVAAERGVELGEQAGVPAGVVPVILEPALPDLAVGSAVDP